VAVDYFTVRLGEDRHGEAKLSDACPNPIDSFVVLARVAFVRIQPFDGPVFDVEAMAGRGRPWIVCLRAIAIATASGQWTEPT
jgi:hypothetical protein